MSDGYKVSVELELEDNFTSKLTASIDALKKANEAMEKFSPGLKEFSKQGEELADKFKEAAESAKELFKGEGLAETVSRVESLAKHSEAFARSAQEAATAYSRINRSPSLRHNGFQSPTLSPSLPKVPGAGAPAAEAIAEKGAAMEGGLAGVAMAGLSRAVPIASLAIKAAMVLLDAGKEGIKTNMSMEDSNKKLLLNYNIAPEMMSQMMDRAHDSEMAVGPEVRAALNGEMSLISEARLKRSELMGNQSYDEMEEQSSLYEGNAATISNRTGEKFVELNGILAEAVKDSGVEGNEQVGEFLKAFSMARLGAKVDSDKLKEALHDIPSFTGENKANLQDNMYLAAVAAKEGLTDGKGGDTLSMLMTQKPPELLKEATKEDKERIDAANKLGLYSGNQATFYTNGSANAMMEMSTLAQARLRLGKDEFQSQAFKMYGRDSEFAANLIAMMEHSGNGTIKELAEMKHENLNQNYQHDEQSYKTGNQKSALLSTNISSIEANLTTNISKGYSGLLGLAATSSSGVAEVSRVEQEKLLANMPLAVGEYLYKRMFGKSDAQGAVGEHVEAPAANSTLKGKEAGVAGPADLHDAQLHSAFTATKAIQQAATGEEKSAAAREREGREKAERENQNTQLTKMFADFSRQIKPNVNAYVYVDGKAIASQLVLDHAIGTTGMNPTSDFLGFGISPHGMRI